MILTYIFFNITKLNNLAVNLKVNVLKIKVYSINIKYYRSIGSTCRLIKSMEEAR